MPDFPYFKLREDSLLKSPNPIHGRICAVFKHSFDGEFENKVLANFTLKASACSPLSVLISEFPNEISIDMPVEFETNLIRIGRNIFKNQGSLPAQKWPLSISESQSQPQSRISYISESLFPHPSPKTSELYKTISKKLFGMLKCFGKRSQLAEAVLDGAENFFSIHLKQMNSELSNGKTDLNDYIDLFGAGEGLTPSWDDLCTGILLLDRRFQFLGEINGKPPQLSGSRKVILSDPGEFFKKVFLRTTQTSYWQIRLADFGKSSLLLEELSDKLINGNLPAPDALKCINVGHTSGTDILCGMWLRFNSD
ncbi:MAG: DUF2877 domain-containing protein [Candidatus Riflebacteria bacterium]|nr:DUF2877 domain-containing protein [Candidatus Riflebacteria bacterium]